MSDVTLKCKYNHKKTANLGSALYGSNALSPRRHLTPDLSNFNPRFGYDESLMTRVQRSRLKGYLMTFCYMSVCGLVLVAGGGAFFIHESLEMRNHQHTMNWNDVTKDNLFAEKRNSHNQTPRPDLHEAISSASYAKELKFVGIIFLGVGTLFMLIGIPLACYFWKRYHQAKEIERCPMMDPKYQELLSKDYSHDTHRPGLIQKSDEQTEVAQSEYIRSPQKLEPTSSFWCFLRQRSVNDETFRIAAHHHPSFNLVPIESLATMNREPNSPELSDDDSKDSKYDPSLPASDGAPEKSGIFFQGLFSSSGNDDVTMYDVSRDGVVNDAVDVDDIDN